MKYSFPVAIIATSMGMDLAIILALILSSIVMIHDS